MTLTKFFLILKGGKGSGNFGHGGRPGKVGGSSSRVWSGTTSTEPRTLSKLKTGGIGEALAIQALSTEGAQFETLNVGINNAPIDLIGDHLAVEVKTGLSTNARDAQKWRATIGEPGKEEKELLKQMTPKEKLEFNSYKRQKILERKNELLKKLSEEAGEPVKAMTIGVILSPDGSKGDVFAIPGFHLSLRWNQYATDEYYLGTYDYTG